MKVNHSNWLGLAALTAQRPDFYSLSQVVVPAPLSPLMEFPFPVLQSAASKEHVSGWLVLAEDGVELVNLHP